jgi:hypothetical protein
VARARTVEFPRNSTSVSAASCRGVSARSILRTSVRTSDSWNGSAGLPREGGSKGGRESSPGFPIPLRSGRRRGVPQHPDRLADQAGEFGIVHDTLAARILFFGFEYRYGLGPLPGCQEVCEPL